MAAQGFGGVAQLLNYGGLGVLALLCLIVLGNNVLSLNKLVRDANFTADRMSAARPLLLGQMAVSLVGLLAIGAAAVYLESVKTGQVRRATLVVDPSGRDIDQKFRPAIRIKGKTAGESERLVDIICEADRPVSIDVDFNPYIDHRLKIAEANRNKGLVLGGLSEPAL